MNNMMHAYTGNEQVLEAGRAVLHRLDVRQRRHPVRGALQRRSTLLSVARGGGGHYAHRKLARQVQEVYVACRARLVLISL